MEMSFYPKTQYVIQNTGKCLWNINTENSYILLSHILEWSDKLLGSRDTYALSLGL